MNVCPTCSRTVDTPVGGRGEHDSCLDARLFEIWGEAHEFALAAETNYREIPSGVAYSNSELIAAIRGYEEVVAECRMAHTPLAHEIRLICQVSSAAMSLQVFDFLRVKSRLEQTRSELVWSQGQAQYRSIFKETRNVQRLLEVTWRNLGRALASTRDEVASGEVSAGNASRLFELGRWDATHGELDRAETTWTKLIYLPEPFLVANTINSLCFLVLMPQGRYEEATALLRRSVGLNVGYQSANSLSNLGVCAFQQDQFDEAREHFLAVLKQPDGPFDEALHYLALIEEARRNEGEATRIRGLLESALPTSEYAAGLRGDEFGGGNCPQPVFPLLPALLGSEPAGTPSSSPFSLGMVTNKPLGSLSRDDRPPLRQQTDLSDQKLTSADVDDDEDDQTDDEDDIADGYLYASSVWGARLADMIQLGVLGISEAPEFWGAQPAMNSLRPLRSVEVERLLEAMWASEEVKLLHGQGDVPPGTVAHARVSEMVDRGWTMVSVRTQLTGSYAIIRAGIVENDGEEFLLVDAPIFHRRPGLKSRLLENSGLRPNEPWPHEWSNVEQLRLTVEWLLRKVETSQQNQLTDLNFLVEPITPPSAISNLVSFPGTQSRHSFLLDLAKGNEGASAHEDLGGVIWAGWQFPVDDEGLSAPIAFFLSNAMLALIDLPIVTDEEDLVWLFQWELMGVPAEQAEEWLLALMNADIDQDELGESSARIMAQWEAEHNDVEP